ncbi:MAG: AgmX/PglI C-terminal domain-containing protein [Kofleriaceae bacterium]
MSTSTPSHPTVEVVATLGESIVGVRHVSDARSGRISTRTRAMLAGAAMMLVTASAAFASSLHRSSIDAERRAAWHAEGLPGWAYRGELGSPVQDGLALLGAGLGLPLLGLGLARRRRELSPSSITIGSDAGVDFAAGATMRPRGELVAPNAARTGFVVDLGGMRGELRLGERVVALDGSGAQRFDVEPGLSARVGLGQVGFLVRAVEAPRAVLAPPVSIERRVLAYVAASAAAHLAVWQLAQLADPSAYAATIDETATEELTASLMAEARADLPPEPSDGTAGDAPVDGDVAALALAEGLTGAPQSRPDPGRRQIANRADAEARARQDAIEAAATAGVLGSTFVTSMASALGNDDLMSGFDAIDRIGGLDGYGPGAPRGFGDGVSGVGPGAGGVPWGTVRVGGYRTVGNTPGGIRYTIPGGGDVPGGRRSSTPPPTLEKPTVVGDLDASMLRRYIRRELTKISYCYEKELLANPTLGGTVQAVFTVNPQGVVVSSTAKGVDGAVSSCVASVVAAITFPSLPSVVQVKYPFTFRSGAAG